MSALPLRMDVLLPDETRVPRTLQVQALAHRLLASFGLHQWSFAFNRRKAAMGMCYYYSRTIELSIHFVERNSHAEILDTLLHEIAHALVGPGHGHDAAWKRKCVQIGARPERVSHEVNMPDGRWQARCRQCGLLHHRHRKPKCMKGWYCSPCGKEHGKLVW